LKGEGETDTRKIPLLTFPHKTREQCIT